jgi:SAM-dependent methyltransferase
VGNHDKEPDGTPADFFPLAQAGQRYNAWLGRLRSAKLMARELLLPVIAAPCPRDLPELMASGDHITSPDDAALKGRIQELSPWGYGIQLRKGITTAPPVGLQRMIYRSHLISGTVRRLLGGDLTNSTVVDFACNHGYFSLEMAYLGAKQAVGVDMRPENIAKANFLKGYFGIENAVFLQQDIYALDPNAAYDVVFNLGVLYHITDPYRLMRLTYDLCRRFAVIDSVMHKEPVSAFIQRVNKDTSRHAEGRFEMELHPTYRAVIDLMHAVGFKQIVEVTRQPLGGGRDCPHELYDRMERRCLIGFKETVALPGLIHAPPA